ncbi:hypothetical protein EYF80_038210 [Liparis tanakae]|uniref:Uncharacterized protein n=1 Tax=Liparis tanakae TaxID=230148 RepID=A0A4Z2GED7_9TELE|nr:hypothetical protein EYF80_038210 [Liparis tanakae]
MVTVRSHMPGRLAVNTISFLLSLGWNLTLKLPVVTSPGYFLSSRFSWSSSSPSEEVYDGAVNSTWRKTHGGNKRCHWLRWEGSGSSHRGGGSVYLFMVFLFHSTGLGEVQRLLPLRLSVALRQRGADVLRGRRGRRRRLRRLHALLLGLLHAEVQRAVLVHLDVRLLEGHVQPR